MTLLIITEIITRKVGKQQMLAALPGLKLASGGNGKKVIQSKLFPALRFCGIQWLRRAEHFSWFEKNSYFFYLVQEDKRSQGFTVLELYHQWAAMQIERWWLHWVVVSGRDCWGKAGTESSGATRSICFLLLLTDN